MTSFAPRTGRTAACAFTFGAVVFCTAAPLAAQSAEEILRTSLERHEERMEGIDRYTVVQEAMGFETVMTFERAEIDGHTIFLPEGRDAAANEQAAGFYDLYPKIVDRAELRGREIVDGEECWIIGVDDLEGLDLGDGMAMGGDGEFVPRTMTMYVDDDYLVRRMAMEGDVTSDGETGPMTADIHLADYRDVEGMLHPFETRIVMSGIAPGMSEEDMERTRESLAEMETQLAAMDASQRAMVERMMGPQMEKLREMLESGQFEMTVTTKEVRVNE